jgi:hypothetical protein
LTAHGYEGPLQSSGAWEGRSPERPRGISHTLDPGEPSTAQARGGVVFVANPARVELSRHPGACIGSHARACGSAHPFPGAGAPRGNQAIPHHRGDLIGNQNAKDRLAEPNVPPDGPVGRLRLYASLISTKFPGNCKEQKRSYACQTKARRAARGLDKRCNGLFLLRKWWARQGLNL